MEDLEQHANNFIQGLLPRYAPISSRKSPNRPELGVPDLELICGSTAIHYEFSGLV